MSHMFSIVVEACMASWNRKAEWNERNLRRRRAQLDIEPRWHYTTCKTNCEHLISSNVDGYPHCIYGHTDHECSCAEISAAFWEAAAEHLAEIGGAPV